MHRVLLRVHLLSPTRVLADVTLVVQHLLILLIQLLLEKELLRLLLLSESLDDDLPLLGRQVLLEARPEHHVRPVLDDLLGTRVVLAGRLERALGAPVVEEHVALQVDCRLLQLVEPLLLQLLPDLLLAQVGRLVYQVSLLPVQDVEPRRGLRELRVGVLQLRGVRVSVSAVMVPS